jgi:pyruvate/2-oxoglutarate dehydrogenase complex dihydrolipoamide acyltransferase (E2) component
MVVVSEVHPAYGNMIEIDHGNSLITRYAHASKLMVKVGAMVKRGQKIAEVGTSGRSTGPHLHFEVMLAGVQQNPARFLAGKVVSPTLVAEAAATSKARKPRRRDAATETPSAWATSEPAQDGSAVGAAAPSASVFAPARPAPSPEGTDSAP